MNRINKEWAKLWLFGGLCLAVQLLCYGAVSLCLADGILLGAGQAALLCLGALWLAFDKRKETGASLGANVREGKKAGQGSIAGKRNAERCAPPSLLKITLSSVWYAAIIVCFSFLATLPLQKGLSLLGVGSLNETAVFTTLWERLLYCWLLPAVAVESVQRAVVLPRLERICKKNWQTVLLAAVFYALCMPALGNLLARFLMGALLCLLYRRTRSALASFSAALAANGFLFLQSYLQTLGLAGAEAYSLSQTLGIGLTSAAPGAVILYFVEKRAGNGQVKPLEMLCLAVGTLFSFALGMALWLG